MLTQEHQQTGRIHAFLLRWVIACRSRVDTVQCERRTDRQTDIIAVPHDAVHSEATAIWRTMSAERNEHRLAPLETVLYVFSQPLNRTFDLVTGEWRE